MDISKVVDVLRSETKSKPAVSAVMHVFAMRKRARSNITVGGLDQKMRTEGFNFPRSEYAKIIRMLSDLGFGKLDVDSKGRVRALKEVKVTLQSIGEAAVGQAKKLENWQQRSKYSPLVATAELIKAAPQAKSGGISHPVSITVLINDKPVNFRIPKELNANEIADLVVRFRDDKEGA